MSYDAALCRGARGDDAGKNDFPNLTFNDQGLSGIEVYKKRQVSRGERAASRAPSSAQRTAKRVRLPAQGQR